MPLKKVKVKLNKRSIEKALKDVQEYKEDLERKTQLLVQRLADEGYNVILNNIFAYDAIETGKMLSTLNESVNGTYAVLSVGDCAMYVEFGTGPLGAQSPYEGDSKGWAYDVGENIKDYTINGVTVRGWFYPDGAGGYRFTQGMPSRPFMNDSAMELRFQVMTKIVKEVFQ